MSRLRAAGTLGLPVAKDVRLSAGDGGVWLCSTRSGVGDGHYCSGVDRGGRVGSDSGNASVGRVESSPVSD